MSQLGEILLKNGAITPAHLEEALAWQVLYGGRLGTNLLELGLVKEEALAQALGQQHGCEHVYGELGISESMIQMIPPVLARRHELFPWRLEDRRLKVITADPASSLEMLDELSFRSGRSVRPVVAPEFRVHQLLRRHFDSQRQMRALDFGQKVAATPSAAASEQEELEDAPDLMDDEQFAALYAHAMQGGVAPGSLGPALATDSSPPSEQQLPPAPQAVIPAPTPTPAPAPVDFSAPAPASPPVLSRVSFANLAPPGPSPASSAFAETGQAHSSSLARSRVADFSVAPPGAQHSPGSETSHHALTPDLLPAERFSEASSAFDAGEMEVPFIEGELLDQELLSEESFEFLGEEAAELAVSLETPHETPRLHFPDSTTADPATLTAASAPQALERGPHSRIQGEPAPSASAPQRATSQRATSQRATSRPPPHPEQSSPPAVSDELTQSWAAAFQELEKELEPAPTKDSLSEDSPLSFQEALAAISQAESRDAVARNVLRYARSRAARAILLSVQGNVVLGWDAVGEDLSAAVARRIAVSLGSPSAFRLVRESRSHYLGPLGKEAGNIRFLKLAGKKWPASALLLPVLFAGRVVYVLYVDNGHRKHVNTDLGELLILSQSISRSMESLVSRRSVAHREMM